MGSSAMPGFSKYISSRLSANAINRVTLFNNFLQFKFGDYLCHNDGKKLLFSATTRDPVSCISHQLNPSVSMLNQKFHQPIIVTFKHISIVHNSGCQDWKVEQVFKRLGIQKSLFFQGGPTNKQNLGFHKNQLIGQNFDHPLGFGILLVVSLCPLPSPALPLPVHLIHLVIEHSKASELHTWFLILERRMT